jgi:coiled-coil domain-containing protein 130
MQGFNMGRYYPPSNDTPTFNTSHPLGARANKISSGILTVRFELPYAVWCNHCKPTAIVGQGVRFNAEKKKVGNYYSTPIWSFRMKHTACGGWWEIRTDPKNAAYVVHEGATKRDYGPDEVADGELKGLTEEERQKRREDAFANLEGKIQEKGTERQEKERVLELYDASAVWKDPYDQNAKLRREFRGKRKIWQAEDRVKEGMQERFSLGIEIVDETELDRIRAKMIDFGTVGESDRKIDEAARKPLFAPKDDGKAAVAPAPKTKKLKAEVKAEQSRHNLQQALVGNTRVVIDPFLSDKARPNSKPNFGILKRKRSVEKMIGPDSKLLLTPNSHDNGGKQVLPREPPVTLPPTLVDYESD